MNDDGLFGDILGGTSVNVEVAIPTQELLLVGGVLALAIFLGIWAGLAVAR